MTGPPLLPFNIAARESSRNPPICLLGPWQPKQLLKSTGRTFFSKNSMACASGAFTASWAPPGNRERPARTNVAAVAAVMMVARFKRHTPSVGLMQPTAHTYSTKPEVPPPTPSFVRRGLSISGGEQSPLLTKEGVGGGSAEFAGEREHEYPGDRPSLRNRVFPAELE